MQEWRKSDIAKSRIVCNCQIGCCCASQNPASLRRSLLVTGYPGRRPQHVCTMEGPKVTSVRALITHHPLKKHTDIKAAQGVRIAAQGLERAIAGTRLHLLRPNDNLIDVKEAAMQEMKSVVNRVDKSEGVWVQASSLGSLEAILDYLESHEVQIPVSGISIGPVHKKDVMRAGVMLEREKEYATILAFDVKVTLDARELADEIGVRILCADIMYHLRDQIEAYIDNLRERKKKETAKEAVFPCVLKIIPNHVFNKKDPIIMGVVVLEGLVKPEI